MIFNQNRQAEEKKKALTLLDGSSGGASVFDFSILKWIQGSHWTEP